MCGLPSDVYQLGRLRRLIFLVWTTLRSSLLCLDNPPKPFSLELPHALTPISLGCPSAYEMHCDAISITHITHANISPCIYLHNLNHTIMLCNFSFHHIKISSRGLMIKHKKFYLNYSTNTLIHKNYFMITVSGTLTPSGIVPFKAQIIGSLDEPKFRGHFRPHTNQYTHQHINAQLIHPTQPWTVTDCSILASKIISIRSQGLGPIKRPFKASS